MNSPANGLIRPPGSPDPVGLDEHRLVELLSDLDDRRTRLRHGADRHGPGAGDRVGSVTDSLSAGYTRTRPAASQIIARTAWQ